MLKIAAVLFLLLGLMALEAAGADGSSGIPMREVDAGEILEKIQKGQPVEYDHIIVRGDLDLSRERLRKNITVPIRINDSKFSDTVSFHDITLEKSINLSGSNFTKDAYFGSSRFSGDTHFVRAVFSGSANFAGAKFIGVASFWEANFSRDADLSGASFNGNANFKGTIFSKDATFNYATFSRDAGFMGATFNEDVGFMRATFIGRVYFREATFRRGCDLGEAIFGGDVDFIGAAFTGNSSFEDAEFNGNIEFSNAIFENETSFYRILFKRPAYFENCSIESLNLTKAEYSRLHLRWEDIGSLHFDDAAYLALIKNYNTLGWYGDVNRCYYDYRNAVRRNWQAPSSGFAAKLSSLLDRFVDFWEWILYGYGVKPKFAIAWCIGIIFAFSLFFWWKRCLQKIIVEERIEDSEKGSDEVQIRTFARKAKINRIDPVLFSLFTFTSGFTSFLHPGTEYKLEQCVRWAIAERLLGPFFLALVITTISKTYLIR